MKILLPIPRYDYGKSEWGDSFEYVAFVEPLESLGHETCLFDTMSPAWTDSKAAGKALLNVAQDFRPDLVLTMLSEAEIPLYAIRELGRSSTTANWFADDAWRFRTFSRHVAPAFQWAITTSYSALERYRELSGVKPLFAPWGFNPSVFRPTNLPMQHDISFIGQRHGVRAQLVDRLREDGLDVFVRGSHWPDGRLAYADLAETFSTSRINLNFLASSAGPLRRIGIRFRGSIRVDAALMRLIHPPVQMKARIVEIPASGGFQITDEIPEMASMFTPGAEVITAPSFDEMQRRIHYYLEHEEERAAIAARGTERAVRDHTFQSRFLELFDQMGLATT